MSSMIDRKKVINGLEYHLKELSVGKTCSECPYCGDNPCEIHLVCDALELLKKHAKEIRELREALIEMSTNGGTGNQQDVCLYLLNLIDGIEQRQRRASDA